MRLELELPEDIAQELRAKWRDLPRHALEAVAIEGYRSGALTESQVRRMLGFETRMEVDAFLKARDICYDTSEADIEREIVANERLLARTDRRPRAR